MKITKAKDGSFDIQVSKKEAQGLLTVFIHGLIGAGELVENPETKEYEPTEELKQILGSVQ